MKKIQKTNVSHLPPFKWRKPFFFTKKNIFSIICDLIFSLGDLILLKWYIWRVIKQIQKLYSRHKDSLYQQRRIDLYIRPPNTILDLFRLLFIPYS